MNQENRLSERQETAERLPTQEEIKSALETILGGKEYAQTRLRSNGEEIELYEVEVVLEDGEKREYNYQKASYDHKEETLPTSAKFSASIHMTKYDSDGIPYDGQCVANYRNGSWQYIPKIL